MRHPDTADETALPPPAALAGVRVLDLSRVLAGPWCTQTLADLGAEVIKVERPAGPDHPGGDDTRGWGPPFIGGRAADDRDGSKLADADRGDGDRGGDARSGAHDRDTTDSDRRCRDAAYFVAANRNKRSITIDLARPEGRDLVRRLAERADVFVENFKVGDMARHGLDAATLCAQFPRLVYCSITGFGQTGPYRDRAGYDYAIQGLGGLMSVTGERDDRPGGGPQKVGVAVADLFAGMYATVAILAALRHRDATGQGQVVDLALLDAQVAMLANVGANYLATRLPPQRFGNAHPNIVPYQVFAAEDGHLIVAVGNDAQFRRFCAVAGFADLADDPRFARNADRVRHRDALVPLLADVLRQRSRNAWLDALEAAKVPCGPINDLDDVYADPQVRHRGLVQTVRHAHNDALALVASPMRLSATPPRVTRAPPLLGEHTDEVLAEIGVDAAERARLRAAGVV